MSITAQDTKCNEGQDLDIPISVSELPVGMCILKIRIEDETRLHAPVLLFNKF